METKKKQFKMPHTFVIIGIIILFAVLLTWIIPAGSYTRFENEAGIKVIDPNDFNYIDKTPVNPLEIPLYIVKAFIKRIDLMLVIMFAGGAFHILTKTGALHAVVAKMAKIFSTTSEPVIRSTISGASTVIMGISALRSAWRNISAGPEMPLPSASSI